MIKDENGIVLSLQRLLAERIGHDRYDVWFAAGVKLHAAGQLLVVEAADQFTLERLKKTFEADLRALCAASNTPVSQLEFRVNRELQRPTPAPATPESAPVLPAPAPTPRPVGNRRTFESFIGGASNRVALTAAKSIPTELGLISPIFFYGPTGSGKTHLLEAITQEVRHLRERKTCVNVSAEQFTCDFLESLQGSGLPGFRRKYRSVDALLIDDVQFFARKKATLVEVQHTLDALIRQGKQVVLAADRPPIELTGLSPELSGRMGGGLVCPLECPDLTTRQEIARQAAQRLGLQLPNEVCDLIAARLRGDTRVLMGALHRVKAVKEAGGAILTADETEVVLADIIASTQRPVQLRDIERAVCEVFGMTPTVLRSSGRTKKVTQPRMLALWLARKYTRAACSEIGDFFGLRSHSTVVSAQKKVDQWVENGSTIAMSRADCRVSDALRRIEGYLNSA